MLELHPRALLVSGMKRTSTSLVLARSVSICQRGLMSQLNITRSGGSYARTRAHWERQEVFEKTSGRKLLDHPEAGRLELEYESFEIAPLTGRVLIVYTAPPGSPTAEGLRLLESVADRRGLK